MIQTFDKSNQGLGCLVATNVNGSIVVSCMGPVWVGMSRQQVEGIQATPPGGFNFEMRDGIYCPGGMVPTVLPWTGNVWVLNGKAPGDAINNAAIIQVMQC